MNLENHFTRMLLLKFCPFGYLQTKKTERKLEKELKRIYSLSINDLKFNEFIKKIENLHRDVNRNNRVKLTCNTLKILYGDDLKTKEELNKDDYLYIREHSGFDMFDVNDLEESLISYITLKQRGIEIKNQNKDYIITKDCEFYLNDDYNFTEFIDVVIREKIFKINEVPFTLCEKFILYDDINLKENELITYNSINERIELIVKIKDNVKYVDGYILNKIDPKTAIKYAKNNIHFLNDIIHLYDYQIFLSLNEEDKKFIKGYISRKSKDISTFFQQPKSQDKSLSLLSKDVVDNILLKMLFPDFNNQEKYYKSKLDEMLLEVELENENLMLDLVKVWYDENELYEKIAKFIQLCYDSNEIIIKNFKDFQQQDYKREIRLKIISKIFLFLNTEKGKIFCKKHEKFNKNVEIKRKEILDYIDPVKEEWIYKILVAN